MTTSTPKTARAAFWQGTFACLPFTLVVGPFGLLFGLVATEAGLSVFETLSFGILVVAGAAQFTALSLMLEDAPTLVILTTSLAVNLRMAMYSASLTPHLGAARLRTRVLAAYVLTDQSYTLSQPRFDGGEITDLTCKLAFYFGTATPIVPLWYLATLIGAAAGENIPQGYALDFAIPIAFIAMISPALRTLAHVVAALVAITASLLLSGVPYSGGVVLAALIAMAAGAETERRMQSASP